MRAPVNRFTALFAGAALLAAASTWPSPASAQAVEPGGAVRAAGEDRWVPALGLTSGVTFQQQDASVSSRNVTTGAPLRPPDSDSEWAVSPYVGGGLQLMTPTLPLPGRPRFFAGGEILPTFAASRDIAKEGDPSALKLPFIDQDGDGQTDPEEFPESAIGGVGSRTTAEIKTLVWGASAGIAFPFEVRGRHLRVKPSVGWIRYKIDIDGQVVSTAKEVPPTPNPSPDPMNPVPPFDPDIREINLSGSDSLTLDGIGPGLEVEMDAFRWGEFGVSLYLDSHAYRVLGKRSVGFSTAQSYPQLGVLPPATYSANWSFEADPWMYRAGVGVRFHWVGAGR